MLSLILPSKGRPRALKETIEQWEKASVGADVEVVVVLNEDDPTLSETMKILQEMGATQ